MAPEKKNNYNEKEKNLGTGEELSSLKKEISKIKSDSTKKDLHSLESYILQHFEKDTHNESVKEKEAVASFKKELSDVKNTIKISASKEKKDALEIYRHDPEIRANFDSLEKKFGPQQALAIVNEITLSHLDITNASDKGRIQSILSLYQNIPTKGVLAYLLLPKTS